MNLQPLPQPELAAWIDAEGIEFEYESILHVNEWFKVHSTNKAINFVESGRAIRLAPGSGLLRCELGRLLAGQGKLVESLPHFREAAALEPGLVEPWFFLGINGHPLGEPLDDEHAEQFVLDVVTGKLEIHQIASGLVHYAA